MLNPMMHYNEIEQYFDVEPTEHTYLALMDFTITTDLKRAFNVVLHNAHKVFGPQKRITVESNLMEVLYCNGISITLAEVPQSKEFSIQVRDTLVSYGGYYISSVLSVDAFFEQFIVKWGREKFEEILKKQSSKGHVAAKIPQIEETPF